MQYPINQYILVGMFSLAIKMYVLQRLTDDEKSQVLRNTVEQLHVGGGSASCTYISRRCLK